MYKTVTGILHIVTGSRST